MRFVVAWDFQALAALQRMHWEKAAQIDAEVMRFAATGAGDLDCLPPVHRLRVAGHHVLLTVDRLGRCVTVLRVFRT